MKLIDREMVAKEQITDKSNNMCYCQASINSDGVITLRNYDIHNKNSDEIIVLSAEETQEIFKLFRMLGKEFKNGELPF